MNQASLKKLSQVHPHLKEIALLAEQSTPIPFIVTEGIRTEERQRQLVAAGASKTMRSRHLTGHAIDIAPLVDGEVRWDWPLFHQIAPVMKFSAAELGYAIEWGGDWRTFKDGPHFQLPWKLYPA